MDTSGLIPAAITGVVGLAGIAASLIAVRSGTRADDRRAFLIEKRKIYAKFNSAIESLWFTAVSSEDFTTEPGRSHYNDALTRLWSSNYGVALVGSGEVSDLANQITDRMTEFGRSLILRTPEQRIVMAEAGPEGEPVFEKLRESMVIRMRDDLESSRRFRGGRAAERKRSGPGATSRSAGPRPQADGSGRAPRRV